MELVERKARSGVDAEAMRASGLCVGHEWPFGVVEWRAPARFALSGALAPGAGGAPGAPDRCGGPTASATPARAAFRSRALAKAAGTLLALAMLLIPPAAAQAQTDVWSGTLTAKDLSSGILGCSSGVGVPCSSSSNLSDDDFTYGGTDYSIHFIQLRTNGQLQLAIKPHLTGDALNLTFDVAGTQFALQDASSKSDEPTAMQSTRNWSSSGLSWTANSTVALKLIEPAATPVTPVTPVTPTITRPLTGSQSGDLLVGNLGKATALTTSSLGGNAQGAAQSFRTGSGGALLRAVRILGAFEPTSAATVSIHSDSSGAPGSSLRALQTPNTFSLGHKVHEFGAGAQGFALAADTTYWVVIAAPAGNTTIRRTTDPGQDGVSGWSLGNQDLQLESGTWGAHPLRGVLKIALLDFTNVNPPGGPRITAAVSIGSPGTDCTWRPGETVDVTLRFKETMTVDTANGTPWLTVQLGGKAARRASYVSGSGTDRLLFSYTVTSDDGRNITMRVPRSRVALNGGTIRSGTANADYWHRHAARGIPSNVPRGVASRGRATPSSWSATGPRAEAVPTGLQTPRRNRSRPAARPCSGKCRCTGTTGRTTPGCRSTRTAPACRGAC